MGSFNTSAHDLPIRAASSLQTCLRSMLNLTKPSAKPWTARDGHWTIFFIERLWRSVKYENVYLYAYKDGKECFLGLKEYFTNFNHRRRHQSLG